MLSELVFVCYVSKFAILFATKCQFRAASVPSEQLSTLDEGVYAWNQAAEAGDAKKGQILLFE